MDETLDALARTLRERLLARAGEPDGGEPPDAVARIRAHVDRDVGMLDEATRTALVDRIAERSFGLGPLEPLLRDPAVDEIMVSGTAPVWVERRGRLEETGVRFASEGDLRHAIERIIAPLGRRVDEAQPLVDARLPDGSRVNVVIPPLALDGPALTIRRFRRCGFAPEDLVANGTVTAPLLDVLARAVREHRTVLVCGGTGSGKTTTLNALSSFIGAGERVVTIEDAAELRLRQPHVIRLEARPANLERRGEVTIRTLVRNALRMRPDRIVIGEVRGPEALDLLSALTTGHAGSLCTIHAGSAAEALRRLETLALMADVGLPLAAIREQVADAVDLVVCQARGADGARRVVEVAEVVRTAGGPGLREVFSWRGGEARWSAPYGALAARGASSTPAEDAEPAVCAAPLPPATGRHDRAEPALSAPAGPTGGHEGAVPALSAPVGTTGGHDSAEPAFSAPVGTTGGHDSAEPAFSAPVGTTGARGGEEEPVFVSRGGAVGFLPPRPPAPPRPPTPPAPPRPPAPP